MLISSEQVTFSVVYALLFIVLDCMLLPSPHRRETPSPTPGQATDDGSPLVLLRALIFQDECLPLVAKLVYDTIELFKAFELQRPTRSKPLPAVRTWHRRIPGLKKQPTHAPLADDDSDNDSDYIP
ncbi:hypothetical protein BDZ89DRAFT_1147264 [Hymenopellis radicata]|nr:hypothetical protein BDZ89DRAFT_1147264 [Hymenopellis radicata]